MDKEIKAFSAIKEGSYVRITTTKGDYEGIIMPRPITADNRHITLKLSNGYNIGIAINKIVNIKKLNKKTKIDKFPIGKIKTNKKLPSVTLFGCGGTIASRVDYETGGVKWAMSPEEVLFTLPELSELVNIVEMKLLFELASESMLPKHWKIMATNAAKALNSGSEGIIFMHGTDAMHYSSAALSFMLKGLCKPVIFTGSQRSSDRGSSDANLNLICSAITAGYDIGEVCICMHGSSSDEFCFVHRGTKVRKMHTSARDAFKSINTKPLLKVYPDKRIEKLAEYKQRSTDEVYADTIFEEKIALINAYPGAKPEIIDFLIDKGYKGIVIQATGLGHVPMGEISWFSSIERAIQQEIAIILAPQCIYGRLNANVYEPARRLKAAGVIYAQDMLAETAYVKLGCVLGHTQNLKEVELQMLTNWAGEISRSLHI